MPVPNAPPEGLTYSPYPPTSFHPIPPQDMEEVRRGRLARFGNDGPPSRSSSTPPYRTRVPRPPSQLGEMQLRVDSSPLTLDVSRIHAQAQFSPGRSHTTGPLSDAFIHARGSFEGNVLSPTQIATPPPIRRCNSIPGPMTMSSQMNSPVIPISVTTTVALVPNRLHGIPPIPPPRPKILFYHSHQPHYGFTNFSPHPVMYKGKRYPTSEHLFQSFKVCIARRQTL